MAGQHNIILPSGLFPFTLANLNEYSFGNYRLINVFGKINESQKQQCVDLWQRNAVISDPQRAQNRSKQVCYMMICNKTSQLVGVNTLYQDCVPGGSEKFWMNRMFIDPAFRDSRLMITGTALMLVYTKTHSHKLGLRGVVNINENGKLSRPGMTRIFSRLGYQQQGFIAGQEVLFFEFDRINILER